VESKEARNRLARATRRYLDLLRDALLDVHYLENELRIGHLVESVGSGREVSPKKLANPARHLAAPLRELKQERDAGTLPGKAGADGLAYAGLGRVRLEHLEACLETIRAEGVPGDLVDAGTGRGGAAIFMRGFLEAYELEGPKVWVADRFDGPEPGALDEQPAFPPDLNTVRDGFDAFGLLDDRVVFVQGPPSSRLAEAPIGEVALLRIASADPDEARSVLEALYERVSPGGFVIVDGYGAPECQASVDAFREELNITAPLRRVDWSAAAWRKGADEAEALTASASALGMTPVTPAAARATELAVVVVVYNMRREAARTLHSLSRSYQRGVDDLEYEVVVVENGSDPEEHLGEEFVRSFGAEFQYLDLGSEATSSPARAVNRGIAATDAPVLAVMIDGAHVLTPGVLRNAMLGLDTYAPAIVTTKQWYLGPGQQPQTVENGYDKELEDRLFEQIEWPADGYRMFEIGQFIGGRDWFDGEWESNCIFVPRALVEQVGVMDESFSTPGGGFVNLDFFERMVGTPGVTLVTMLGEGSFHQLHGGTTTNISQPQQLIRSYDDQYEELRGRRFQVPPQRAHFVGSLPPSARRTRPRRMTDFTHFKRAQASSASGESEGRPMPVPQDLTTEFIDAFWRSGEWHRTSWLDRLTHRPPTDLVAYQELIYRVRPDWVIETRTGAGGRALFLASICDLVGSGHVLSIDSYPLADPPDHSRITYLRGDPAAEETAAQVREITGERPRAMVILGAGARLQVLGAFRSYAPLVPIGSYVVVEDTILEGNPVWPEFGNGPATALTEIVNEGEFVPDRSLERFALTFNPGGFLRRVRFESAQPMPA
jgi:cephalosporin hydroxylase